MADRLTRTVTEPVNPKLNVSRNANLPHSPGIWVGEYIFLSGMGPVDPVTADAISDRSPSRSGRPCATWRTCWNPLGPGSTGS